MPVGRARYNPGQTPEDEPQPELDDAESIEDAIDSMVVGGGGEGASSTGFIGNVPDDYTVLTRRHPSSFEGMSPRGIEGWASQGAGPGSPVERGPRYRDGDEMKPAGKGRDAIMEIQTALRLAGYLEMDIYVAPGAWDKPTMAAYKQLLAEANYAGLTASAMLRDRAMSAAIGQGPEGSGPGHWEFDPTTGTNVWVEDPFAAPPLQLRTTSKDDLRAVFRASVRDRLGQGWSDGEIDELVDAYNWQEIRLQTEAYNSEVNRMRAEWAGDIESAGEPIVSVDMASPEAFVEEEMRRRDPAGVAAGDIANEYAPAFFEALGGFV